MLTANLILNAPVTADFSSWYAGASAIEFAIPFGLAVWGLYTAMAKPDWGRKFVA
jgi:hypothetical protein